MSSPAQDPHNYANRKAHRQDTPSFYRRRLPAWGEEWEPTPEPTLRENIAVPEDLLPGPTPRPQKKFPSEMPSAQSAWEQAYIPRVIARISVPNRTNARRYITAKSGRGVKTSSLVSVVKQLHHLDELGGGVPFTELGQHKLESILAAFAETHGVSSVRLFAITVKGFYTWLNGGRLPDHVRMALTVLPTAPSPQREPITEDEFQALLEAANRVMPRRKAVFQQALLWMLWDTGFRVSELLGLTWDCIRFNGDKGTARIELSPTQERLKTGPRVIYIAESVGALKLWKELCIYGHHPKGLVFHASRGGVPMTLKCAGEMLVQLCKNAGLSRRLNPHLFRHTRATRAARAGWKEAQLRAYFGWGPGSAMPHHYVHLAEYDVEEMVREAAHMDPLGALVKQDPQQAVKDTVVTSVVAAIEALKAAGKL